MKRFVKKTKLLQMTLVGAMLAMIVGVVFAAPIIDDFSTGAQNFFVFSTTPTLDIAPGGIGGERDVVGQLAIPGGGGLFQIETTPQTMAVGNLNSISLWNVQWDGNDTAPKENLDPVGLGGIDVATGNDGVLIRVLTNDYPANIQLVGHNGGASSTFSFVTPGDILVGSHVDFLIPFAQFSDPSVFNTLGAFEFFVDNVGGNNQMDLNVALLDFVAPLRDFGDLPDVYQTLDASGGPKHLVDGLRLGNNVDVEADGAPALVFGDPPLGDDSTLANDEQEGSGGTPGVQPTGGYWRNANNPGGAEIRVFAEGCVTGSCYLNGWIDWNNDGSFAQLGDNILTDYSLVEGSQTIQFDVPAGDPHFNTAIYARFRICHEPNGGTVTRTCFTPSGETIGGEIEDYQWSFGPTAVNLQSFSADNSSSPIVLGVIGFVALLMVGFVALVLRREQKQA